MTRIYLAIDETNPLQPVPVLRVNGQELRMTERELDGLLNELIWARETISKNRGKYYSNLATKYKETERVR